MIWYDIQTFCLFVLGIACAMELGRGLASGELLDAMTRRRKP